MKAASSKNTSGIGLSKSGRSKSTAGKTIVLPERNAQSVAEAQFNKIKEALKEVEQIEAGKIQPKSLDDLLNEL